MACIYSGAVYRETMLIAKEMEEKTPVAVVLFRVVQGLLFLYSFAILALTIMQATGENGVQPGEQFAFGVAMSLPLVLGSGFSCLALFTRYFCSLAIFFCAVLFFFLPGAAVHDSCFFSNASRAFFPGCRVCHDGFGDYAVCTLRTVIVQKIKILIQRRSTFTMSPGGSWLLQFYLPIREQSPCPRDFD